MRRFRGYLLSAVVIGILSLLLIFTNVNHVVAQTSGQQPFQQGAALGLGDFGFAANLVIATIPPGKRLVVEHFSAEAGVPSGQHIDRFVLGVAPDPSQPGNVIFSHFIPAEFHTPCSTCVPNQELFVATQPIRLYVDDGQALVCNVVRSSAAGDAFVFVEVSGYLVDITSTPLTHR